MRHTSFRQTSICVQLYVGGANSRVEPIGGWSDKARCFAMSPGSGMSRGCMTSLLPYLIIPDPIGSSRAEAPTQWGWSRRWSGC
jgi:hypothetical protein